MPSRPPSCPAAGLLTACSACSACSSNSVVSSNGRPVRGGALRVGIVTGAGERFLSAGRDLKAAVAAAKCAEFPFMPERS